MGRGDRRLWSAPARGESCSCPRPFSKCGMRSAECGFGTLDFGLGTLDSYCCGEHSSADDLVVEKEVDAVDDRVFALGFALGHGPGLGEAAGDGDKEVAGSDQF